MVKASLRDGILEVRLAKLVVVKCAEGDGGLNKRSWENLIFLFSRVPTAY